MSSLVIKVGSLVVKTLSKPIAVGIPLNSGVDYTDCRPRIASRLKPENMSDSAEFVSMSPKAFTAGICDSVLDSFKILPQLRSKLPKTLRSTMQRDISARLLR